MFTVENEGMLASAGEETITARNISHGKLLYFFFPIKMNPSARKRLNGPFTSLLVP